MSVFDMPRRLYIISDIVITATYGMPSAKYNEGTHAQGLRCCFIIDKITFPDTPALHHEQ